MYSQPFGCHVRRLCVYTVMKVPRLPQDLSDASPEDFSSVKCLFADWLVKRKALNIVFEKLLGEETDVEDAVEFPVVVDVADVANPKALRIELVFWLGVAQGVTKALHT